MKKKNKPCEWIISIKHRRNAIGLIFFLWFVSLFNGSIWVWFFTLFFSTIYLKYFSVFFLISICSFGCWSQLCLCWTSIHTALKLIENRLENHMLLTNTWLFIYTHKVDIMYRCLYLNTVWHDLLGSLSCYLWPCLYKSCFTSVVNIHRKK